MAKISKRGRLIWKEETIKPYKKKSYPKWMEAK